VKRGAVEVLEPSGGVVSLLGPRNSFGERGLMRERAGGDDGAGDAGFCAADAAGGRVPAADCGISFL
jgi:hypothetical protein